MFLLDTNALSELRRPERADPRLLAWAADTPASILFLSAITLLEIEMGALRIARRDARQGAVLRTWIDSQVLPTFADRVLPVDTAVALRCATLHVPDLRSERDALIGATALVHGMTVVTRNQADFIPMGVALLNPWG
ncbi:type II toxin-antitoxin system VapC family toxin [Phenylobacterium sp.]|uniref:type II toxin-antitoxin system VapC family toxin n=1 Tax=Phenylobacterium sp. TaxID=1871053 RepID=UPI0027232D5E|nr:type II toxin-antitoxin system VapC family toxin [Phenylobacterium sp.]MDO8801665.1 type II toxin-antitoxin system VapC family toxin [Phenylobacterium sp.]